MFKSSTCFLIIRRRFNSFSGKSSSSDSATSESLDESDDSLQFSFSESLSFAVSSVIESSLESESLALWDRRNFLGVDASTSLLWKDGFSNTTSEMLISEAVILLFDIFKISIKTSKLDRALDWHKPTTSEIYVEGFSPFAENNSSSNWNGERRLCLWNVMSKGAFRNDTVYVFSLWVAAGQSENDATEEYMRPFHTAVPQNRAMTDATKEYKHG